MFKVIKVWLEKKRARKKERLKTQNLIRAMIEEGRRIAMKNRCRNQAFKQND